MSRQLFGLLMATLLIMVGCGDDDKPLNGGGAKSTWEKTFGGTSNDIGASVAVVGDGGYILAGSTKSFGAGDYDVYVIKTDASGDTAWTRTYGDTATNRGFSAAPTSDGGYIVAGHTYSVGAGGFDVYLIKTDASGDTVWTRAIGGAGNDLGQSVVETGDGGFIAAALTGSYGAGGNDVYLIKTDASGDTVWTRAIGGTGDDNGSSVAETDGGFVVAGYTKSFGAGDFDMYLIMTNASGDTVWTKTYGGSGDDRGRSVLPTTDGGYVVAGHTNSLGAGGYDVYLVKTDIVGDTVWTRTFGGIGDDFGVSVAPSGDGGYVVGGQTGSFGVGGTDFYLVKTDAFGDTVWTRTFGGAGNDYLNSLARTSDGGYSMLGNTNSFGAGGIDMYVVKVDADGNL